MNRQTLERSVSLVNFSDFYIAPNSRSPVPPGHFSPWTFLR